ncbi:MAG: branched-chain amino acid ABC transporter permease [Methylobacteriaceae bacterium]|nr:branched-chain amino acid ABC transporter permease [Methylobacteriaceae bacterium]
MDSTIVLFLVQDAVINGAIYALIAIALVLVFAVTRVILVPQGEFVAFAGLTVAALEAGRVPPTLWLLVALGVLAAISSIAWHWREMEPRRFIGVVASTIVVPLLLILVTKFLAPLKLGLAANTILTLLLIVPMGPLLYRIAFEPLAEASVLVLLIASFGVHLSLVGLGLAFFGPEGVRTAALSDASYTAGALIITGQSVVVIAVTLVLLAALALFFGFTPTGKALRACASNRLGARLVGIPTSVAGQVAFAMAALIGAVSGILITPITAIYYDSGFLIGLKGFVAAIVGGLASYTITALAALGVGLVESFSSFWWSTYKEVFVFTIILPVLVWRSLRSSHLEDDE